VKNFLQKIFGWLKPQYHELLTYQSAIICILLLIAYPELRLTYEKIIHENIGAWVIAMSLIGVMGMIFSIWHVFTQRKKSNLENQWMGAFAMSVNGLAGIAAGIEIFPARWSIMTVFPIWNILSGAILLYQMGFVENVVTDDNASLMEVAIATISLLLVFVIAKYGIHLTWAMTFSVCMFYSSIITFVVSWLITRFRLYSISKSL
jgi:hypothetical protein